MIIDLDGREVEVEDDDVQSFLMMISAPPSPTEQQNAEMMAQRFDAAIGKLSESLRNAFLGMKQEPPVVVDMTEQLSTWAESIKKIVNQKPKEPSPVKTIVVTDIERGRDGLIVSCNLEVKR